MIKHTKILFVIMAGFLASVIISCNAELSEEDTPGYRVIENEKIIEDTACYSIRLQYPSFIADADSVQTLEILNAQIEGFLDTAAHYYWRMPPDSTGQIIEEAGSAGIFTLDNRYTILDTTNRFISLKMETYSYALGAHGFTAIHTYNFDIENGVFLKFDDILDLDDTTRVAKLNALLKENFENPEDCFNDEPTANGSFELFAVEPEYVVFYYEAYELGAYYCGTAIVKVPVKDLREAGLLRKGIGYIFTR